jgi:hypothetical protein
MVPSVIPEQRTGEWNSAEELTYDLQLRRSVYHCLREAVRRVSRFLTDTYNAPAEGEKPRKCERTLSTVSHADFRILS